jgi:hypothetical protein
VIILVTEDKWFYFVGGRKAGSIEELEKVLPEIDDAEFVFHVNSGKNDFANWVEGVFNEKELASEMRGVLEKPRMIELIGRFLLKRSNEDKPKHGESYDVKEVKSWDDVVTDVKEEDLIPPAFEIPATLSVPRKEDESLADESPKSLSEDDLRSIVMDSRKVLKEEEPRHRIEPASKDNKKFIVKEFIYGFIIGLIFGLIMLGILLNLKPYC